MRKKCISKQLKATDENSNMTKTCHDRFEIEKIIMNFNRVHFKNACSFKTCNQNNYELLQNNVIREKKFSGTLDENYCDDEDARKFLNLLQYKDSKRKTHHSTPTELEWEMIVNS